MKQYTCFVISPIGAEGTEVYEEYKDLLELIIIPALEIYNIQVKRGDHFVNDEKIDSSVIRNIQDADICICDISLPNPNVYYELGRRDETGKPILLLKKKGSPQAPVDIATRRYFEYEWDGRYAIREAQNHIRAFVEPLIEEGFEERGKSATLSDIADSISRLERKIDRLATKGGTAVSPAVTVDAPADDANPADKLKLAVMQTNVPLAEQAMDQLQDRYPEQKFYDQVVRSVASMGSERAGEMLLGHAREYFDSDVELKKKLDYLASMVTYATKRDKSESILELFLSCCKSLEIQAENEAPEMVVTIYNQQNRLFHSIYLDTRNTEWLDKALSALKKAISIDPRNYMYYNMATCYYAYGRSNGEIEMFQLAQDAIERCLTMDTKDDKDHLEMACKIYAKLKNPKLQDTFDRFAAVNPIRAKLIAKELFS